MLNRIFSVVIFMWQSYKDNTEIELNVFVRLQMSISADFPCLMKPQFCLLSWCTMMMTTIIIILFLARLQEVSAISTRDKQAGKKFLFISWRAFLHLMMCIFIFAYFACSFVSHWNQWLPAAHCPINSNNL